ncbi:copper transport protein ATX1 [Macadamia integrifolia]|uniref:copper transport protein ATX1 n=1 Tax=Macadamia integrifolia TaxID=60698 RepID=UPI001C4E583B|nr:copper transport protein ATX1 [Macadamia integrifolia]
MGKALRIAENLTVPSFQVIVMRANLSCTHCQDRVSQVISKMNELLEYEVDVRNKQVILKGGMDSNTVTLLHLPNKTNRRRKFPLYGLFGLTCFTT